MLTSHNAPQRIARIAALSLAFLLLLASVPSGAPAQAQPPAPAAVGDSITWNANAQIITNVLDRANFPRATVDSNNKTHVVFITKVSATGWEIRYINNVSGAFNNPGQLIDTIDGTPSIPSATIIADSNNVLHLIYVRTTSDNRLYYRQSTNNGSTWSPREQISATGNAKASEPSMVIDPSGNVHMVWLSNECGANVNVYYRVRSANGQLSPITKPKDNCSVFQNRPVVTFAGGKPHVAFSQGNPAEIYYARLEGGQWLNQNVSNTGTASLNTALASDGGNNLFLAWDENAGNHEIWFKASFDGGLTWSAPNPLTNNPGISTYPYVGWSSVAQRAYIVWHDQNTVPGGAEDIWEREFDPATKITSDAFQVSKNGGLSKNPMIALGPSHADIVWHDNSGTGYQIYDLGGLIKAGGGGCSGTLSLAGGAAMTKSNPVPGAITATCSNGQSPDQMQISVDTPITSVTDPAPVAYNQNPSIQIPAGGCEHTVYIRLFQDNKPGAVFQAKIKVDNSVDATVYAANPNMAGLPPIYSQRIAPADAYLGGAKDGDPRYTRVRKFFLGVNNASDCAGLKEFSAIATGEPVTAIGADGFAGSPALPGSGTPGSRNVTVLVTDTLDTGQAFTTPLIYDPADTDSSEAVTNTLGLPVLNMSQNPTVAAPATTNNIIVTLSFNNIQVSDNLYGDGTGPGTNDYWGVWVASSPTDIAADSSTLNWVPIAVPEPGSSFSIQWSLFSGIDSAADRRAGAYFVYVRFLDGAGNPSAEVLKTQTTLSSPFTMPTIYTPVIHR